MKQVILDTNFLLIPAYFGVDIITGIEELLPGAELVIHPGTERELKNIQEKQRGKEKKAAALAMQIIRNNNINKLNMDCEGYVDGDILTLVDREKHIVATQDKELKDKLKKKGIPIIILRQKRYVELV
ncbi:nucleotide-binding protein [Candidatus Woesearchaeota archaeon]|nr:nucleotide-binding protein [Candidatus Woesearchaeota archaeon]